MVLVLRVPVAVPAFPEIPDCACEVLMSSQYKVVPGAVAPVVGKSAKGAG